MGKRRSRKIGTMNQFPTKASAWRAAKPLRDAIENQISINNITPTLTKLVEQYRAEKMPKRVMTRQGYNTWLNHYIVPRWGNCILQELQARPLDLWLQSLNLAPKSKVHIRGLVRVLWDFAMWRGDVPLQRNPMELVRIKGASKRIRQPRSLTVCVRSMSWRLSITLSTLRFGNFGVMKSLPLWSELFTAMFFADSLP